MRSLSIKSKVTSSKLVHDRVSYVNVESIVQGLLLPQLVLESSRIEVMWHEGVVVR